MATAGEPLLCDLSAPVVASFAGASFLRGGRTRWTAALLHRALELDAWNGVALKTLSAFLDDGELGALPSGLRRLSAVVLERILAPGSPVDSALQAKVDDERFLTMWVWKFSRRRDGKAELSAHEFHDRAAFVLDHEGYRRFWAGAVEAAGSFDAAFAVAASVPGYLAGFLTTRDADRRPTVCGAYRPDDLEVNHAAYDAWLTKPAEELEWLREGFKGKQP
jgi:hypothetical protein